MILPGRRSKASKIGQMILKVLKNPHHNSNFHYYVRTNNLQDIKFLTIMSGKEKIAKAVKEEEKAFAKLIAQRKLSEQLLREPD